MVAADGIATNVSATLTGAGKGLTLLGIENVDGTGNGQANQIIGNKGSNELNGAGGADTLTGGVGNDVFVLKAGEANGDVIADFSGNGASAGDTIRLEGYGDGASLQLVSGNQWRIVSNSVVETVTIVGAVNTIGTGGIQLTTTSIQFAAGTSSMDSHGNIIYLGEPFFQDGIVAQAADDVAAAGVAYFSSAGNRPATQAYDSQVRIVPPSAMQGTNLNFSNVDPALYAGGFHDFAPGSEVDIAQNVQFANGSTIVFQWNEPFDPPVPRPIGAPLVAAVGTVPPNGASEFTFPGTAGQVVEIFLDADNTTTGVPIPDVTFAVIGPDNVQIQFVDTDTNPESLTLELPLSGTYRVVVDAFTPAQFGDFLYRVQPVQIIEQVLSDYNLLFFRLTVRSCPPCASATLSPTGRSSWVRSVRLRRCKW
ncbi:MAG: hypothetical protein HC872_07310 [Gammaproteobacteria bacterium]|nr:hypothetical protein [Gammaproteobacteria bacterium]